MVITDDMIKDVESALKVNFPEDFLSIIRKYDGGYPKPHVITVDGNDEVVNNIVSFSEGDLSFIVDIYKRSKPLKKYKLIPIAEDPFGNYFCYDFIDDSTEIVFWDHELKGNNKKFVCKDFTEFLQMLHE